MTRIQVARSNIGKTFQMVTSSGRIRHHPQCQSLTPDPNLHSRRVCPSLGKGSVMTATRALVPPLPQNSMSSSLCFGNQAPVITGCETHADSLTSDQTHPTNIHAEINTYVCIHTYICIFWLNIVLLIKPSNMKNRF